MTAFNRTGPILMLSSSLLTDRMLQYSSVLPELTGRALIWASSAGNPRIRPVWERCPVPAEPFPHVEPNSEAVNLLRRLDEYAWDARLRFPSRTSMDRHVFSRQRYLRVRLMKLPGAALGALNLHPMLERVVERMLVAGERSKEASRRLRQLDPAAVLCMNPFWFTEPAVVGEAKRLGIPVFAFIPSWDNISTKGRMVFRYDGYFVWSRKAREELLHAYPDAHRRPVHVVGAPQFDVFFDRRFEEPRQVFCARHGLDPALPIVVYAVGSPNFLKEHHGALEFARAVADGKLGDVQVLIRPHPIHDRAEMDGLFQGLGPRVRVQGVKEPAQQLIMRSQDADEITDWVSTFRHSDVVVNLSSTVTVDAALFDKPVVNLNYDPEPGQPNQRLVEEINSTWTHYSPVAQSGGVWLANDFGDVLEGVRAYLADPALHREGRKRIVAHVCGVADGRSGGRFASALLREARRAETVGAPV